MKDIIKMFETFLTSRFRIQAILDDKIDITDLEHRHTFFTKTIWDFEIIYKIENNKMFFNVFKIAWIVFVK